MRKYLFKIALFFIAVAVLDIVFGYACQYMNSHSKGGGIKSRYYVCKESSEDVLIFGSSRAKHHYVPDIIETYSGFTCYNTGEDGNGIILSYGFLKMITERYTPKVIIYDVSSFDILVDDNMKYLDLLKPYYNEPGIDCIFWDVEPKTRFMMLSSLYKYNTTWLRIAGSYIHPISSFPKGYGALHGVMNYEPIISASGDKEIVVDDVKLQYFRLFIDLVESKDITLICCVSPIYRPTLNDSNFLSIKQMCENNNIVFLDFMDLDDVSSQSDYFQDRTHMNDKGARLYSERIALEVVKRIRE